MDTTPGQLLLSRIFPPDAGYAGQELTKSEVAKIYTNLAARHAKEFPELSKRINQTAARVARSYNAGGFSLDDFYPPTSALMARQRILNQIRSILARASSEDEKRETISEYLVGENDKLTNKVYEEADAQNNPFAHQVRSGARGNKMQLKRIIGGDTVYTGRSGDLIPIPVTNSYSMGVTPAEFWAASYGARRGLAGTKLGVADAGYLGKLLIQASHRLIVTAKDSPLSPTQPIGMPIEVDDPDNIGAFLAVNTGPYKRNTPITPAIADDLKNLGYKKILIRSPISSQSPNGVYAADVGYRGRDELPGVGEMIGIIGAQAIGERIAQTSLGAKHTGGAGKREVGFSVLERLVNIPKQFRGGAEHSSVEGKVTKIEKNELGQHIVYVDNVPHIVDPEFQVIVKVGDHIEAGDILSDGIPNPAKLVAYKGIGEGRRQFVKIFTERMKEGGYAVNRRNVEIVARGLIDHVEVVEPFDDYLPGDIVPYSTIAASWNPRKDSQLLAIQDARNWYLEQPVLHYTIGTKITPTVIQTLKEFGIDKILVNKNPPPFAPTMIRAAAILEYDPNWLTRLFGANQLKTLLNAARRGADAPISDTSFVPAKVIGANLAQWIKSVGGEHVGSR